MKLQYSISTLAIAPAFVAVTCMTIVSPNDWWGNALLMFTVAIFVAALFRGTKPAWAFGIVGWVALTAGVGFYDEGRSETSQRWPPRDWMYSSYEKIRSHNRPRPDFSYLVEARWGAYYDATEWFSTQDYQDFPSITRDTPTFPNFVRLIAGGASLLLGLIAAATFRIVAAVRGRAETSIHEGADHAT